MSYVKTIVCLANSQKVRGRCIAGKEVLAAGKYGGWIRPVSARTTAEVLPAECRYVDNTIPRLLDIVDVPLLNPVPVYPQAENHILDPGSRWSKRGELPWADLERLRDHPPSLWLNNDHTLTGVNDCMGAEEAASFHKSLSLIRARHFMVEVGFKTWDGVRSKIYRGHFNYYGTSYNLSVTYPAVRSALTVKGVGRYLFSDVFLCISLTEPYDEDGRCHKLVAAVIRKPLL